MHEELNNDVKKQVEELLSLILILKQILGTIQHQSL